MRKTLCSVAIAGLLGFGMTAFAQDSTQQQPADAPAMHGPAHRGMDPGLVLDQHAEREM